MQSHTVAPSRRSNARRNSAAFVEGLENRTLMAAPVAGSGFYAAPPNGVLNVDAPGLFALAIDPDGDAIVSATISLQPSFGVLQLNSSTGAFSYTPNAGFTGFDNFMYFVSDGTANSNHGGVLLFVGSRGVTATDDVYVVNQDESLVVTAPGVLENDSQTDNFPITAVLDTLPAHGTLSLDPSGAFTYTPTANFHGIDTFTYHANDGTLDSNLATVTITVQPTVPPPPTGNLADMVRALRENGALNHGQYTSLLKKLELAIDRNKPAQEMKKLEAFIKQVESLMKGKHPELTPAQGQALISAAQALLATL